MLEMTIATESFTTFAADAASGASNATSASKPAATAKPNTNTSKPRTTTVNKPEEVYVVKAGDVLSRIAVKYDIIYQEIAAYNNIKNPHLIYIGQKIVILAKTTTTTAQKPAETKPTIPEITKPVETPVVDAITSASVAKESAQLDKVLSDEGAWTITVKGDIETNKEIVIEGEFRNKNKPENDLYP